MVLNLSLPLCSVQYVLHLVRSLPLRTCYVTDASNIPLGTCPSSSLLTRPSHFSLFSVMFFVTGATLLILSHIWFVLCYFFFVTPHIHRII